MFDRVSGPLLTLLVALLACSTPTSPTITPPPSRTPTPEPTAILSPTPPTEEAGAPDAEGIELIGPPEFIKQAQAALDLLASCDPTALAAADAQLVSIVHSDRSGMDTTGGVFMASDTTAFAPDYPPAAQVFWFAGAIIHDAHHRQQAENGVTNSWDELSLEERQQIEHEARAVQIDAMENCLAELPEESRFQAQGMLDYLVGMQTGEIPCDYCAVEWADRDW